MLPNKYKYVNILTMGVREDINVLLKKHNWTIKEMAIEMQGFAGKKFTPNSLYAKLKTRTLRYEEAQLIGDILGYELKFVKKTDPKK